MRIRIILADDHKIMREGLRALLEKQQDMEVVAEAKNGREAIEFAQDLKPDVVLMDVLMPDLNGIDATRQIINLLPGVKIIALSMHSDRRFVARILWEGAAGYILKDSAFRELVYAIRYVLKSHIYLSPEVTEIMAKDYVYNLKTEHKLDTNNLSPREREVVQLLAEGKSSKEIASCLFVSSKTIEVHRHNIMEKLNIHSVAGLTKFAIREGLTSLEK